MIDVITTQSPRASWHRWIFPAFWDIVFCIGLALSVLARAQHQPATLHGWPAVVLAVLLIANFGAYNLIAWGWLYSDRRLPARWGLLLFGAQLLLLSLLIWWYGAEFAWICLALLYPVIGGLPLRQWPLPLACLLVMYLASTLLSSGADPALLVSLALQIIVNTGIAIVLRLMTSQSARLRAALMELRQAHAELA